MKRQEMCVAVLFVAAGTGAAWGQIDVRTKTVAAQGQAAPGAGANVFFSIFNAADLTNVLDLPVLNGTGGVAFRADLTGAGTSATTNAGVWAGPVGGPGMVARKGSTADGLPVGVNYNNFSNVGFSNAGVVCFLADLTGAGITSANNEGLWVGFPGALNLIGQRGSAAPGVAAPGVFSDIDNLLIGLSDSGVVCARGTLTGAGIGTTTDRGLWAGPPAHLVAREGDPAAGLPAGVLYGQFDDANGSGAPGFQVSSAGIAYYATVTGTGVTTGNDTAIWLEQTPGVSTLVARKGDPATAFAAGATYTLAAGHSLNNAGSVIYRATVTGGGTAAANNVGLVRWRPAGPTVDLVARKGGGAAGLAAGVLYSDFTVTAGLQPRIGAGERVAFLTTLSGTGVVTANNQALYFGTAGGTLQPVVRKGDAPPGVGAGQTMGAFDGFGLGSGDSVWFAGRLTGTGINTANDGVLCSWSPAHGLRLLAREAAVVPVDAGDTRVLITSGIAIIAGTGGQDGLRNPASNSGAGMLAYRGAFSDGSAHLLALETQTFPCGGADMGSQGGLAGFDGVLDNNDFVVYINYFFNANPLADVGVQGGTAGTDGVFDNNDFVVYINLFFTGC